MVKWCQIDPKMGKESQIWNQNSRVVNFFFCVGMSGFSQAGNAPKPDLQAADLAWEKNNTLI